MIEPMECSAGVESENLTLECVVGEYQSALLRYTTRVLNNADAAQDVVQETFIRLHQHWGDLLEQRARMKGWLYRTAHNAAVDYIRKEERRKLLHWRKADSIDPVIWEVDDEQSERHALVMQYLNILKPKEREVLVLRMQEEMSYKEIAEVINRSEGYVGTLIHSATQKLTQSLKRAGVVS